jgi:hypothetical protein
MLASAPDFNQTVYCVGDGGEKGRAGSPLPAAARTECAPCQPRPTHYSLFTLALAAFLSILLSFTSGCETKTRARLEARQAYVEGQQQALEQSRPKPPIVTVTGPVHNHILPWTEELTLIKAILAADYTGYLDPRLFRVIRDGQTTNIKPSALLNGQDMPLQAGDTIQVVP